MSQILNGLEKCPVGANDLRLISLHHRAGELKIPVTMTQAAQAALTCVIPLRSLIFSATQDRLFAPWPLAEETAIGRRLTEGEHPSRPPQQALNRMRYRRANAAEVTVLADPSRPEDCCYSRAWMTAVGSTAEDDLGAAVPAARSCAWTQYGRLAPVWPRVCSWLYALGLAAASVRSCRRKLPPAETLTGWRC